MEITVHSDASYLFSQRIFIGKRIREIRKLRGYSQQQLAELIGTQRSTISKIETGKFSVGFDFLSKLSVYLKFDVVLIEKSDY